MLKIPESYLLECFELQCNYMYIIIWSNLYNDVLNWMVVIYIQESSVANGQLQIFAALRPDNYHHATSSAEILIRHARLCLSDATLHLMLSTSHLNMWRSWGYGLMQIWALLFWYVVRGDRRAMNFDFWHIVIHVYWGMWICSDLRLSWEGLESEWSLEWLAEDSQNEVSSGWLNTHRE